MSAPLTNNASSQRTPFSLENEQTQRQSPPRAAPRIRDTMSNGQEAQIASSSNGRDTLSSAADASRGVSFNEPTDKKRKRSDSDEDFEPSTVSARGDAKAADSSQEVQGGAVAVDSDDDEVVQAPAKKAKIVAPDSKDTAPATKADKADSTGKKAKAEKTDGSASASSSAESADESKAADAPKPQYKPYSIGTCLKNFFVKALWGGVVNVVTSVFNFFVGIFKACCCFCKKELVETPAPQVDVKKEVEAFKATCNNPTMGTVVVAAQSKLPPAVLEGMKEIVFKDCLEKAKADLEEGKEVDEKEVRKATDKVFEAANADDIKTILASADKYLASLEPKLEPKQEKGSEEEGSKAKTKAA